MHGYTQIVSRSLLPPSSLSGMQHLKHPRSYQPFSTYTELGLMQLL
jgi:hypothetical protein